MRTKIISAFPGTGKSVYHSKNKLTTLDADSSNFSWEIVKTPIIGDDSAVTSKYSETKVRNPNFPQNYIDHIKANIGKYDIIFVSSHKEVREALFNNCIFFYLVYPCHDRKNEFLKRYKERGNDENFINLVSNKWEGWISEIEFIEYGCHKIKMILPNLEDEIRHLNIITTDGDSLDDSSNVVFLASLNLDVELQGRIIDSFHEKQKAKKIYCNSLDPNHRFEIIDLKIIDFDGKKIISADIDNKDKYSFDHTLVFDDITFEFLNIKVVYKSNLNW